MTAWDVQAAYMYLRIHHRRGPVRMPGAYLRVSVNSTMEGHPPRHLTSKDTAHPGTANIADFMVKQLSAATTSRTSSLGTTCLSLRTTTWNVVLRLSSEWIYMPCSSYKFAVDMP